MAIPVQQFPMPTFQQSNPWLQGLQAFQGAQKQAVQNQYLGPMLKAKLGQTQAATGLAQAQTKYLPLTSLTKAMQTAQTGTRFGPAYQLSKVVLSMDKPSRDQWISNNQLAYNTMVDTLGNTAIQQRQPGGTMPKGILGAAIRQYFPQYLTGQQPTPAGTAQQPTSQPPTQQPVTPGAAPAQTGAPNIMTTPAAQLTPAQKDQKLQNAHQILVGAPAPQAQFGSTPQQVQQMKLQNQYNANRNSLSPKMKTQQDYSIRSERFLQNYRPIMNKQLKSILEYSGAKGRGQRYFNQWANQNNEKVADYNTFKRVFVPNMANIIRQMESMGATDQQQKSADEMFNVIDHISNNPTVAKSSINKAIKLITTLSNSTIESAEPINRGVTRKIYNLHQMTGDYIQTAASSGGTIGAPTPADIAFTAKKHGMTVQQVRQRLGMQ